MSLMNRSALNSVRGSIGMGQGNIRNEGTRNKDMANTANAVSWKNPGMQQQGSVQPSPFPSPQPMGNPVSPPAPMPQFEGWGDSRGPQGAPVASDPRGGWGGSETAAPYAGPGTGWRTPTRAPIKPPAGFFTRNAAVPPAPPKPRMAYPDQDISDPMPVDYSTSYVQPNFAGGY